MLTIQQALAVKLGCVTGMDLAQMNRAHLPTWANWFLYIIAEAAIICTDIGQVRQSAHHQERVMCLYSISFDASLGHWDSDRYQYSNTSNPFSRGLRPFNCGYSFYSPFLPARWVYESSSGL